MEEQHEFNTYNLADLFKEQSAEKQIFETSINFNPDAEIEKQKENELQAQTPVIEVAKIDPQKVKKSAWFVTKRVDQFLNYVADEIACNGERGFKTDDDELKELASYWEEILKPRNGFIPVWLMLTISSTMTYGATFRDAFKARKINKRAIEENARKDYELELLKAKIKMQEDAGTKSE
jgi:hypothetical protein